MRRGRSDRQAIVKTDSEKRKYLTLNLAALVFPGSEAFRFDPSAVVSLVPVHSVIFVAVVIEMHYFATGIATGTETGGLCSKDGLDHIETRVC